MISRLKHAADQQEVKASCTVIIGWMNVLQKPSSTWLDCDPGASCSSCVLQERKSGLQKEKNGEDSAGSSRMLLQEPRRLQASARWGFEAPAKTHRDQKGRRVAGSEEKEMHIRGGSWLGPPAADSSYLLQNWSISPQGRDLVFTMS